MIEGNNINKNKVLDFLRNRITNPKTELNYSNNFELLVAVMLSAQCTDKRVNIITDKLFQKYKTPYDFAKLSVAELEECIKSCNYYHNKAKNIILCSQMLIGEFGGKVPSSHSDLVKLPGVGNKTANVMLAVAFGIQAMPVDTHVLRVSNRLGFVDTDKPIECEKKLKEIFIDNDLTEVHHLILLFGRYFCTARNPKCDECGLRVLCKYYLNSDRR